MKEIIEFEQGFKPKGKVKVQLFDENGQVVNEQKSENFIAKTIQGYFDHVMRNIFTRNRATGGHELYNSLYDPFATMVLTDAAHPEDPQNEWVRAGNIIGYAHTTGSYSGTDTLRGGYNLSESFTNREQVHIVIDFPTHAGNGTFQSIYFSAEYNSLINAQTVSADYYGKIQKHNGKIYAKRYSNSLSVLDKDFKEIEQITVGSYSDFWIVGNVIYYTNENYEVTSAPLNDPAKRTSVVTLDNRATGIVRHESSGKWYLKYSNIIYVYDSGWNLLSSFTDIGGSAGSIMAGSFDEGIVTSANTFIWVGGKYNNNMTRLHNDTRKNYQVAGFVDGYTIHIHYLSNNWRTYRIPTMSIGSRALLDEPVTKGNTQTMKITYDFMLPPMN